MLIALLAEAFAFVLASSTVGTIIYILTLTADGGARFLKDTPPNPALANSSFIWGSEEYLICAAVGWGIGALRLLYGCYLHVRRLWATRKYRIWCEQLAVAGVTADGPQAAGMQVPPHARLRPPPLPAPRDVHRGPHPLNVPPASPVSAEEMEMTLFGLTDSQETVNCIWLFLMFWFAVLSGVSIILGTLFAFFLDDRSAACKAMAPMLYHGERAVVGAMWFQWLFLAAYAEACKQWFATAPRTESHAHGRGRWLAKGGEAGQPLRLAAAGVEVTVVAYVPSLDQWRGARLPFPARELSRSNCDSGGGVRGCGSDQAAPAPEPAPPLCAICLDDFRAPYLVPPLSGPPSKLGLDALEPRTRWPFCLGFRFKLGWFSEQDAWAADPLWELRCGHTFHEACCATWFEASAGGKRCPYCNQDVERRGRERDDAPGRGALAAAAAARAA